MTASPHWSAFLPLGGTPAGLLRDFAPVWKARLKTVPEDFQVTEALTLPECEETVPHGQREHLWLWVEKQGANTAWVAAELAGYFGVRRRDVGFSGHKDRHALTRQWFSLWLPGYHRVIRGRTPAVPVHPEFLVLQAAWQRRKLQRGTHRQNHFRIRLRGVRGASDVIQQRLAQIRAHGVPNLFGPQRFGHSDGQPWRTLPSWFEWAHDSAVRGWQISALRSALFNRVLAMKVDARTWRSVCPGDWLQWRGSRAGFPLLELDDRLSGLVGCGELSPTTWMPGAGERPESVGTQWERQALMPCAEWVNRLQTRRVVGFRRRNRLFVDALQWQNHGSDWWLDFSLPSGSFATTVLAAVGPLEVGE